MGLDISLAQYRQSGVEVQKIYIWKGKISDIYR